MVCTRTSAVPCAISQRRKLVERAGDDQVLNSITPQNVIQSTFQMPVSEP